MRLREKHPNGLIIHADNANGEDRTLCGAACEGVESGDDAMQATERGKINCADCAQIIEHCHRVSLRSLAPRGSRRSVV